MKQVTVENIICGIVTYNPNIKRLEECLKAVKSQLNNVIVYDNGSKNSLEISKLVKKIIPDGIFVKNAKNMGIAKGLAEIMNFAKIKKYLWVLALDQDSILQKGLVKAYLKTINSGLYTDAGMLTCLIRDRNFNDPKYERQESSVLSVKYCITSASLTNVTAYFKTSGYDRQFFIDCVDFDICYSLSEKGYKIYRINYLGLLQEVGHGENRNFLFKQIVVYHEKPIRIYYLSRNLCLLYVKHSSYKCLTLMKKELALFLKIILYEDAKKQKIFAFFKGLHDAAKLRNYKADM